MKKVFFWIIFCAFCPSMASADHHHTSIGVSVSFGERGYRGCGYYAPRVNYYSYSCYPSYSYRTCIYPPPAVYIEPETVYVPPPRVYVQPAPRIYYYDSRYLDYGGRYYYESDRPYCRY